MATGATEFIDHTTAAASLPEVWAQEVIRAREEALQFADLFDRRFEKDVMKYGAIVHVQNVSHLAAQTKTLSANAATVYETVTETDIDITVNVWEYNGIAVETALQRQANRNMLELYAPEQAYALALSVDTALAAFVDDFSNSVGSLNVDNTYGDILRAEQYLNDANVPMDGRKMVVSPAAKNNYWQMDYFIHNDYSGLNDGVKKGPKRETLGTFLNMPVYMSTNVEGTNAAGHDGVMCHTQAVAFILQMKPTVHGPWLDPDYLAHKVVVEQLYGALEERDDHGVWVKGR